MLLEEGSGSARYEVTQVGMTRAGQLSVNINSIVPGFGTCDMALWHVILELNSTDEVTQESDVLVNPDNVPAAGTAVEAIQPFISYADSAP